ncbi:PDZ domain-containing protein [Scleromatobacter humisilvae]|uniref:PDZ domain-containing protein n=1 Tax=Scleromatobacter humisilvae TaxID=2897159 RepID=A0A9X1YPE3_9BURK|nr:PDZ domain-containing protein [Scleromatobacter humisilvae]MCK9689280.1 PDZ domain-containing protein [Scleromatobacter humisilvae]
MSLRSRVRSVLLLAAAAASFGALAEQGRLGFSVAADTDGMFSHTLKSLKITAVAAGAPAAEAGLKAGDEVVALDDVAIAGADGSKLMDTVRATQPGQHLRLKIRRDGAERLVDIVAGPAAK